MKALFRWYGPSDAVTLERIRQIPGVHGVVTACYDIPAGERWPEAEVAGLSAQAAAAGLTFPVAEGVPVHESIKLGRPDRDIYLEAYCQTIRALGRQGVRVICYNFMPVFGWIRTQLHRRLPDGSETVAFSQREADALDPTAGDLALPGWNFSSKKEELGKLLEAYRALGPLGLRENLRYFLTAVVPAAEAAGVTLAIHPDDPALPIFGLPRIVSTAEDVDVLLAMVDSGANGLTLCTGSLGSRRETDLAALARRHAKRIPFVHARNLRYEPDGFYECGHAEGDLDLFSIFKNLRLGGFDGYVRADHGRMIWGEAGRPGYGLFDRALGISYLTGLWEAVSRMQL